MDTAQTKPKRRFTDEIESGATGPGRWQGRGQGGQGARSDTVGPEADLPDALTRLATRRIAELGQLLPHRSRRTGAA